MATQNENTTNVTNEVLYSMNLTAIRARGKKQFVFQLQALYDADILGLAGVQKIYHDAFGGRLVGVKEKRPSWTARLAIRLANFLLDTFSKKITA
jgi:hypothetical protein